MRRNGAHLAQATISPVAVASFYSGCPSSLRRIHWQTTYQAVPWFEQTPFRLLVTGQYKYATRQHKLGILSHNPVTYMLGLTNVCCVWCSQGAQPLYWGATEEGQLLLGSHLDELEGCSPTATMFPPGAPDCMLHVSCFWILEVDVWYWDFVGTAVRVYSTFTVHDLASSATSRV